jgi:hypothetical protein
MPQIRANGLELYYESHGPEGGEPILLIMGLGAQMTTWPPELIARLTDKGYRVIAYDNMRRGSPMCWTTWPMTRPACWTPWAYPRRTSSAPRWAG